MKGKELFAAVRLYGLDVLLLRLIARLLDGLSKKLAVASAAISQLAARKKEARLQKKDSNQQEKRAD